MKYIDADKLKALVKRQIRRENFNFAALGGGEQTFCTNTLEWILKQIDSLPQEQPSLPSNLNEAAEEYLEQYNESEFGNGGDDWDDDIRITFKAGAGWMAGQMKQKRQKQQKVDLEKFTEKMNAWKARYNHPDKIPIKATMAFTARMFYMYPTVAREWYDSLPKVTQD